MRKLLKQFSHAKYRLQNAFLPSATPRVKELLEELRNEMRSLPDLPEPATEAEADWQDNRRNLRENFLTEDPRRLFLWSTLIKTMLVGDAPYTSDELADLKLEPGWSSRWGSLLSEPPALRPKPHYLLQSSSGNTIHHVYHLKTLEAQTNTRINESKLIVEFGGGYGNMCRLIHNLGFRGKYIVFDLPEFSILQRFYFGVTGLEAYPLGSDFKNKGSGIFCCSSADELASALQDEDIDLFLATWSFSEAPLDVRDVFIPYISKSRRCFFAYQDKFQDVDNLPYFSQLGDKLGFGSWDQAIAFLPGNHYQILQKAIGAPE